MGDLLSPKRRDVFDRLRRRIEQYRRCHNARLSQYEGSVHNLYDQQNQDLRLLRQRWDASRAKRVAKPSKSKDNSASQDQRSLSHTTQRKRKFEGNHGPIEGANLEAPYNFDESANSPPPAKANCTDGRDRGTSLRSSVSVNIVQQFNTPTEQQIQLTVQTSVAPGRNSPGVGPSGQTSTSATTSVQASTSNICKQEPLDESCHAPSSNSSHTGYSDNSLGLDEINELQAILDTLEKEEGKLPPDLVNDWDNFKSLCEDDKDDSDLAKSPMFNSASGSKSSPGPSMFAEPLYDSQHSINMGGQGAAAMTYSRPPTGGGAAPPVYSSPPPILSETGPAAETLKQMAAQHQNQQQTGDYPIKGNYSDFVDDYRRTPYPSPYPPGYPAMGTGPQSNMYPYSHQMQPNHMNSIRPDRAHMPPHGDLTYGQTKPLTHYPEASSSAPSSLQQLQNQVQSHFSQAQGQPQGPHLQISQSQQMQLSGQGNPQMLSQTQQMQIRGGPTPQQISVAQQQSFSLSGQPGMSPHSAQQQQFMSEQMKMRMYHEKQQMQGAYMGRPPPEYKVRPGMNGNYPPNTPMGMNPLQTMQNMVNQTPNGMYAGPTIKTEGGVAPQSMGHMPNGAATMPAGQSYPGAMPPQRPPMMTQQQAGPPQSMANGSSHPGSKASTPTYTSAIMRNQRPPNVNVGPEGLNISQPRSHPGEWSAQGHMTPNGVMSNGPPGASVGHMNRPPNASMMQYAGYQGQMMAGPRMQVHQQQAAVMQHQAAAQHGHPTAPQGHPSTQGHPSAQGHPSQHQQGHPSQQGHPGQQGHPAQQVHPSQQGHPAQQGHPGQQGHAAQQVHPGQQGHPNQQGPPSQQGHPGQGQPPHPGQQHPNQQGHPGQQGHSNQQGHNMRTSSAMMIQQQSMVSMTMSQTIRTASPANSQPGTPSTNPSSGPSYPQPPNGNPEFPLDFLDNTQGNSDFFDSMVPNTSSDLLDEIFGGTK